MTNEKKPTSKPLVGGSNRPTQVREKKDGEYLGWLTPLQVPPQGNSGGQDCYEGARGLKTRGTKKDDKPPPNQKSGGKP